MAVCPVDFCGRTKPRGSYLCARCERHVHPATWLAVHDVVDEYVVARDAGDDLQLFLAWAWRVTIAYARDEAYSEVGRRWNPEYDPWSQPPLRRHDPEKVQ